MALLQFASCIIIIFYFSIAYCQELPKGLKEAKYGEEYSEGFLNGQQFAINNVNQKRWIYYGLVAGLSTGPIGFFTAPGIADISIKELPDSLKYTIDKKSIGYKLGYTDGYAKILNLKRTDNLLIGSILGAAIFMAVLFEVE